MKKYELTDDELEMIKSTLSYYKNKTIHANDWPSYESKQKQLEKVDILLDKLKAD